MQLEGSCHCGAIRFSGSSDAPYPYRVCYCPRCRKVAGGAGAAVNIIADAAGFEIDGDASPTRYETGITITSFCPRCGSALFLVSPLWPDWVYPFASAIDTPLPVPPHRVHIYTGERPAWVPTSGSADDPTFDENTEESIFEWHERLGLKSGT